MPPAPDQEKKSQGRYPERKEWFDVVLMKAEVGDHDAPTDAFKRVHVEAESPLGAQSHADVEAAKAETPGWRVLFAVPPGVITDPERRARERELQPAYKQDLSKVRFR